MSKSSTDRNLLFGILAMQMDFIGRDALIAGMNAWVLEKSTPLGQVLLQQKALSAETHCLLEALVQKHLSLHQNDPEQSLAAIRSIHSVGAGLAQIADEELQGSLARLRYEVQEPENSEGPETTVSFGTPTSQGSRFRVLRPHAKGGLGEVFVAYDEELHRQVALKHIQERHADDPSSRSRFVVEAEITGSLEHPGIVPVYGLGRYGDGRPFYAMRFIKGQSLRDAIRAFYATENLGTNSKSGIHTGVEFRQLLGRFLDVCHAIQYAHDRGVVHRDLKPANIMLGPYGETLVVDWGLAKPLSKCAEPEGNAEAVLRLTSADGAIETMAGQAIGTPQYMSPEQAAGRLDEIGPASDVYCLGATLYCLLTGNAPFDREDQGELLRKVAQGKFQPPRTRNSTVPPALDAICRKAMATRQRERYSDPKQLATDVERWLADEPVSAWPEPMHLKAGRWIRRHKPLVSGAAAALLVCVIGLSAGAVWYEQNQARQAQEQLERQGQIERQRALTEQGIDLALQKAHQVQSDLQDALRKPGGVQTMLNQPARWESQIKSIQSELDRAGVLANFGGSDVEQRYKSRIGQMRENLLHDEADNRLALRLEKIRLEKATLVEGKYNNAHAIRDYTKAFEGAGFGIKQNQLNALAEHIQKSAIKEQLLATMDDWAIVVRTRDANLARRLMEAARLADPDPWRNQARDPALWQNSEAMAKVAEQVKSDPKLLAKISPQLLGAIHVLLPHEMREKWLRQAQALYPEDFWLNFDLGFVLVMNKKPMEGIGFYRAALALRPNTSTVYGNLGFAYLNLKDMQAAIDAYKKALSLESKDVSTWNGLGMALHAKGELVAASQAYKKTVELDPGDATGWSNLGTAMRHLKDLPSAADAYQKAVVLEPKNAENWGNLGYVQLLRKDFAASVSAYEKALELSSSSAESWSNLGNALGEQKKTKEAITAFKKSLEIDPNNALTWTNLGSALFDQHDLPEAIQAIEKALVLNPRLPQAWETLGLVRNDQKDTSGSIAASKKALELNAQLPRAWHQLGVAHFAEHKLESAVAAFKKSLALDPQFAPAWNHLGNTFSAQQNFSEAVEAHKRALTIEPNDAIAWYNLGVALRGNKDVSAAVAAYKKALAINDKLAPAWINLSSLLLQQKNFSAALDAANNALAIVPSNSLAWTTLGLALRARKDLNAARDAFEKAIEIDPKDGTAHGALGQVFGDQGDFAKAIAATEHALEVLPKGHAMRLNGEQQLKQLQRLLILDERLPKALKGEKFSPLEYLALADFCHHSKKRYRDAVELYAKAFDGDPKIGQRVENHSRYNAACAALLAAAKKGMEAEKLPDREKRLLRQQALEWLKADLEARSKHYDKNPANLRRDLKHWQNDDDLASVREPNQISQLPAAEQAAWRLLWDEVKAYCE